MQTTNCLFYIPHLLAGSALAHSSYLKVLDMLPKEQWICLVFCKEPTLWQLGENHYYSWFSVRIWFLFFVLFGSCYVVCLFSFLCVPAQVSITVIYSLTFPLFLYRFVRPTEMSETRINEYIEGKYGKFGVDRYASNLVVTTRHLCFTIMNYRILADYGSS